MSKQSVLEIAAVVLVKNRRETLVQKRGSNNKLSPNMWEFPGGKCEGKSFEATAVAELWEEVGVKIDEHDLVPLMRFELDKPYGTLRAQMYVCEKWDGEPYSAEGQPIEWVKIDELGEDGREYLPKCEDIFAKVREFLNK